MKILWVNPWFGNYRVPVYKYLKEYTQDNFYLIYGTYSLSESLCQKLSDTLGDKAIPIDNSKRITIGDGSSSLANTCISIPIPNGVYGHISKIKPDIIICDGFFQWGPVCMAYCKLHNIPLVIDYERTAHVERNSKWWRTLYRKLFGKMTAGFVVNGSLTVEYLNQLGLGHKPIATGAMAADSFGLKNAVCSVDDSTKEALSKKLSLADGMTYLFIGQLVERKGVRQLLNAWEKHSTKYPSDNLLILGEGVLEDELRKTIQSKNLRINLMGQIPYDEIAPYYAISDVMLMPTLEDNWSLVIPEAMACGLPVLCAVYNGGCPELVKDGINGYQFDPLNEASFLKALEDIHSADLKSMSRASIEIEQNYTPDKAAMRIFELCDSLYKKHISK